MAAAGGTRVIPGPGPVHVSLRSQAALCIPEGNRPNGPFSTHMLMFWDLLASVGPLHSHMAVRALKAPPRGTNLVWEAARSSRVPSGDGWPGQPFRVMLLKGRCLGFILFYFF